MRIDDGVVGGLLLLCLFLLLLLLIFVLRVGGATYTGVIKSSVALAKSISSLTIVTNSNEMLHCLIDDIDIYTWRIVRGNAFLVDGRRLGAAGTGARAEDQIVGRRAGRFGRALHRPVQRAGSSALRRPVVGRHRRQQLQVAAHLDAAFALGGQVQHADPVEYQTGHDADEGPLHLGLQKRSNRINSNRIVRDALEDISTLHCQFVLLALLFANKGKWMHEKGKKSRALNSGEIYLFFVPPTAGYDLRLAVEDALLIPRRILGLHVEVVHLQGGVGAGAREAHHVVLAVVHLDGHLAQRVIFGADVVDGEQVAADLFVVAIELYRQLDRKAHQSLTGHIIMQIRLRYIPVPVRGSRWWRR